MSYLYLDERVDQFIADHPNECEQLIAVSDGAFGWSELRLALRSLLYDDMLPVVERFSYEAKALHDYAKRK